MAGFKTYLLDYTHDGGTWPVYLLAKSWKDAEARLVSIAENSQITGELHDIIECDDSPLLPGVTITSFEAESAG